MTIRTAAGHRVAIIGGGLIGLCAAFYLDQEGCQVTIFEKEEIGSGASRGNGGQVVPADPLPAPGMISEGLRHWFTPSSAFYVNPRSLVGLAPFLLSGLFHGTIGCGVAGRQRCLRAGYPLGHARELAEDPIAEGVVNDPVRGLSARSG